MGAFPANTLITEFFNLITGDTPHLALYTSNPGADNSGTEISGGSYAREPMTFSAIVDATISNNSDITFSNLTFNIITHWGIFDAISGGNLKIYGPLTDEMISEAGDNAVISANAIIIRFYGS